MAHGFDRLMDPGVGENITFVGRAGSPRSAFAGFDEIVDAALALRQVGAVDLINAMGNPAGDQGLGAVVPQRAVYGVIFGINHVQAVLGRRLGHFDRQGRGKVGRAVPAGEGQGINAGSGKRGGGLRREGIGERHRARAGSLAQATVTGGPVMAAAPPPALRRPPPPPRRAAGLR